MKHVKKFINKVKNNKKYCEHTTNNKIETTECYKCKKQCCDDCIDTICCCCCFLLCNECAYKPNFDPNCDCYGECAWCNSSVNKAQNQYSCNECNKWWCQNCERDFNCKGCKEIYL